MKFSTLAVAAVAAAIAVAPAQAATYLFAFTAGADSGSGSFTTAGAPASAITGISGTVNGFAITGLSGYAGADNIFYGTPHFSVGGVSFVANSIAYNLYYQNSAYGELNSVDSPIGNENPVALDISITAVPEPATWAMLIAGFAMVGVTARRRSAVAA